MTDQPRLTNSGPVIAALIEARRTECGWFLQVRHRHPGGLFADCETDLYSDLTLGELEDVLSATVALWEPPGPH